ncbi:hypothetical protein BLA39750_02869 [Burkholderia lata]|uniref:Uncharacterized protein n=1 Tax=Burkholderia lata (strain ATCC 17760 / DSM 23089 / LMG 22485 / NCIMB 9086 / R18194 / 383) TaxID=482957 RepID=A0A6P2XB45_BURL3|nr:hypothetical protein BLA39750_02869 [Burkholderia lata]
MSIEISFLSYTQCIEPILATLASTVMFRSLMAGQPALSPRRLPVAAERNTTHCRLFVS